MSSQAREKTRLAGFNLWVEKSRVQYGGKFDYMQSDLEFVTQKSQPVKIRCIKHDEVFEVLPFNHLRFKSGGCKKCDEDQASTYFLERERIKFNKFFEKNLSERLTMKSEFRGMTTEMIFYCRLHEKSSAHKPTFLMNNSAYGCLDCAKDSARKFSRLSIESVMPEVEADLPDHVRILGVEFNESKKSTYIRIACETHGEQLTTKGHLKRSHYKCPKCGDESVGYTGYRLKKLIETNQRGRPTYLGVMEVEVFGIKSLKVGVTTRTLNDRYKWHLKKIYFSTQLDERDAYILENRIHRAFKDKHDLRILMAGMRQGERWGGDTECYWHDKLDEILKFIREYINLSSHFEYEKELSLYEVPDFFPRDVSRKRNNKTKPIAVVGVDPYSFQIKVEFDSISDAYKSGFKNVSMIISEKYNRQIAHGLRWFKKSNFDPLNITPLKIPQKGNPRSVICVDTGEIFQNIKLAEQTLRSRGVKISGSHISSACKGKRKIAGGFRWVYVDV